MQTNRHLLKAAIALAGALFGPLFGLYILGILCPFANAMGVIAGLIAGQTFTIWVLIGSLLYPSVAESKETSIAECSIDQLAMHNSTVVPVPVDHSGVLGLYHMAFLLVPISGFVISMCVGSVVSLISGGRKTVESTNPNFLSPLVWYIWPASCVPKQKRTEEETVSRHLIESGR